MTTKELLFGTALCPVNKVELARIVGVTPPTVYRWSKDPGLIPWEKMKKIIKVRGLSAEDVMKMVKER